MNAESFQAQFDLQVTLSPAMRQVLHLEREVFGFKVYRLLDRVVLEREGQHSTE